MDLLCSLNSLLEQSNAICMDSPKLNSEEFEESSRLSAFEVKRNFVQSACEAPWDQRETFNFVELRSYKEMRISDEILQRTYY